MERETPPGGLMNDDQNEDRIKERPKALLSHPGFAELEDESDREWEQKEQADCLRHPFAMPPLGIPIMPMDEEYPRAVAL